eukprot:15351088-Ditylum_brightwellii.AAC.2
MQKAVQIAQKKVKEILKDAKHKHFESNTKIANIHPLTGNVTKEQALKAIIHSEAMSTMWKKIKFTDKGMEENNLKLLQIPESWPDVDTWIARDTIKEQSNKCIGGKITWSAWNVKVKKCCKAIAMSPSVTHLGHLKALVCLHSGDINMPEGQELTDKQNNIIDAYLDLMKYSIVHKYSFRCWKNIVTIIIVKEVETTSGRIGRKRHAQQRSTLWQARACRSNIVPNRGSL